MRHEQIRFFLVGAINSLGTYLLYWFLLPLFGYGIAYGISYVVGILFSYSVNAFAVFKIPRLSWVSFFSFFAVYVGLLGLNLGAVSYCVEGWGWSPKVAPLVVMLLLFPINFLIVKRVLTRAVV